MYRLHYFLNALGVGGTEKTAMLFAKHLNQDFSVRVFTYTDADLTRRDEFDNVVLLDRKNPDWHTLEDCDILHVFRSGYQETPEPGVDVNVPHFVETNIFGFLDPNPRIDRTLFMSKWLMDYALRGKVIPDRLCNRFDFVNNPVEEPYTNNKISGLSSDIIWLGRCGRPDNGIYNAVSVEAARLLRMQGYDVGFLVMAPPSNMIADLARYDIPFKTYDPTTNPLMLSQFYNSVDIYAHARADGETYGVNIAEAMIHGKPVVTHIATPSVPGMGVFQSQTKLVSDGLTGFVCSNDPVNYMDALKRLIDDVELRKNMGHAGLRKAMNECHVDVCQAKLESIYREIVS